MNWRHCTFLRCVLLSDLCFPQVLLLPQNLGSRGSFVFVVSPSVPRCLCRQDGELSSCSGDPFRLLRVGAVRSLNFNVCAAQAASYASSDAI